MALELRSAGLPVQVDGMRDATDRQGTEPRDISSDLDLRRVFAGFAELDQLHFGPGGFFDCDDPLVWCGQPVPIGGQVVLVGVQTYGSIDTTVLRNGELALAFARTGGINTPPIGGGAFGGADLIIVADLTNANVFELTSGTGGNLNFNPFTPARVRIDGDTALFVVPMRPEENPRFRAVGFERIPPDMPGGERVDSAPGVDSFFDVFVQIEAL